MAASSGPNVVLKSSTKNDSTVSTNTQIMRTCEEYLALWTDCATWRNKFHEYYVHGEWPTCTEWKEDYNNCILWKTEQSMTAKEALLQSEKKRLKKSDDSPPVWEMRAEPYTAWNAPRTINGATSVRQAEQQEQGELGRV